jgi:hypothetical protein
MSTKAENRAEEQARAKLNSIVKMVRALDKDTAIEDYVKGLSASQCIMALTDAGLDLAEESESTIREQLTEEMQVTMLVWPNGFEWDEVAAREAIEEDALSIQVREGWHSPGEQGELEEFEILLCTGGPAVRIVGDLDRHKQPDSVRLQYQDWGTPWTEYLDMTSDEREALLTYCQQFYFGE